MWSGSRQDPGYIWSDPCKPRMGIEWFGVGQTTLLARYCFSNSVFLIDVENEAQKADRAEKQPLELDPADCRGS